MRIALAPMEGVCDVNLRQILTGMGGFDYCVTEFIRVSHTMLPDKVFYRECPELHQNAKTASSVPVHLQLLGSDPRLLADNAARAVELGAPVIDLNFGCPARCVNKHTGGSYLLQYPDQLFSIVEAVRAAVPESVPVTAKMRLGFKDKTLAIENAQALEAGGASWLTVHGRTKAEAYRPPAYWNWIGKINDAVAIPVVANGEIWSVEDAMACRSESGCEYLMLGRGALARPDLARLIKGESQEALPWSLMKEEFIRYFRMIEGTGQPSRVAGRLKQWLVFLQQSYPDAAALLMVAKRLKCPDEIYQATLVS
ncbi:MAG: tRNA-dihydrouridine synthase [Gammaproteobacteria bacterium]|nr:tRNA-dihydrouridine synthase [Gammaproteobacteria bacterium]